MGRPRLVKRFNRAVDINQGKIGGAGHYQTNYIAYEYVPFVDEAILLLKSKITRP